MSTSNLAESARIELLRPEQATGDLLRARIGDIPPDGRTFLLSVPAPLAAAEALLAAFADSDAVFWAPGRGEAFAGIGSSELLTANGRDRFASIEAQALSLFERLVPLGAIEESPAPRLFGGFAFQAGRAAREPWQAFDEARFVLPRLSYTRQGDRAWLSVAAKGSDLANETARDSLSADIDRAIVALGRPLEARPRDSVTARPGRIDQEAVFSNLVDAIREAIHAGRFEKIVAARRVVLELSSAPDPAVVLQRLASEAPECARFALSVAGTTFLGATPERLVEKRGNRVETEAVAGSVRAQSPDLGAHLLESEKDLSEHALVVRELLRALEPLSKDVEHRGPDLYRLRHVLHLRTSIRATLREPLHVLKLVERLHPTPAVGGVPTAASLSWIAEREPDERGYYAGPIGWFDARGDGDFAVALRSGVLKGNTAHLYVGAGIVRDSEAASEYAETRWKLAALLGALGVTT